MHLEDSENKIRITTEAFIICENEILLFKRSETSKVFPGFWSIPGGHVDDKEDVLAACIREVFEETGLKVAPQDVQLKFIALHHHLDRKEIWHVFGFLVIVHSKHIVINSDEGESKWVPLSATGDMDLFPPVKYYLNHSINSKSGLMYVSSDWEKAKLLKVHTKNVDKNH